MRFIVLLLTVFSLMMISLFKSRSRGGGNISGSSGVESINDSDTSDDDVDTDDKTDDDDSSTPPVDTSPSDDTESNNYYNVGDVLDPRPLIGYHTEWSHTIYQFQIDTVSVTGAVNSGIHPKVAEILFVSISSAYDYLKLSPESNIYASALFNKSINNFLPAVPVFYTDSANQYGYKYANLKAGDSYFPSNPENADYILRTMIPSDFYKLVNGIYNAFFSAFSSVLRQSGIESKTFDAGSEIYPEFSLSRLQWMKDFCSGTIQFEKGRISDPNDSHAVIFNQLLDMSSRILESEISMSIRNYIYDHGNREEGLYNEEYINITIDYDVLGSLSRCINTLIFFGGLLRRVDYPRNDVSKVSTQAWYSNVDDAFDVKGTAILLPYYPSSHRDVQSRSYSSSASVIKYLDPSDQQPDFTTTRLLKKNMLHNLDICKDAIEAYLANSLKLNQSVDTVSIFGRFIFTALVAVAVGLGRKNVWYVVGNRSGADIGTPLSSISQELRSNQKDIDDVFSIVPLSIESLTMAVQDVVIATGALALDSINGNPLEKKGFKPNDKSFLNIVADYTLSPVSLVSDYVVLKLRKIR